MTISSATTRVLLSCDGSTKVFPVSIQAYLASDFLALLTNNATGSSVVLNLNSDYSMASGGTLSPPSWTLTTLASIPYVSGNTLQVILDPDQTQLTQYVQGQAFPSPAVQQNVDRLTQMVIRLQDQVGRTVIVPDGDVSPLMQLPAAGVRANSYQGYDVNGNLALFKLLVAGTVLSTATLAPFLGLFQAPAEAAAGVTPVNLAYPPGDDRRYGAVGDGATDDTTALSNMINIANASTGGIQLTFRALTYGITAPLPRVTANGVQILGIGTDEVHSGPGLGSPGGNTTVIKWIGSSSAGTIFSAGAPNGAAQFMVGFKLLGITFDCNVGTIQHGVLLQSMRGASIDIFVKEAGTTGLEVGPVASMTFDPPDFQFNTIKYKGLQNAAAGVSLVLNGTVTDNTSLNVFTYVDILHCNAVAINGINCDSNVWLQVRLFHNPAGSAIYSWTCQGSNILGFGVRSEQIFRLSASLPMRAFGAGLIFPAGSGAPIKIYNLDKSNGSPDPVMDITSPAQIVWQNDTTPIYAASWVTYTPTITNGGSGFVAGAVMARYLQEPRKVTLVVAVPVTTAGTGTANIQASLPPGLPVSVAAFTMTGYGYDDNLGVPLTGTVQAAGTVVTIIKASTGGYPASSGSLLTLTIEYETA